MIDFRIVDILLVEDNPADVRLTIEALKSSKIKNEINVVEDGEEAMEYLRKKGRYAGASTPDLILLDLNLPKKDGREVLKEIKEDNELKKIPVVILTSSEAEDDIAKAYQHHANCYISKPVDFKQFLKMVHIIQDFWLTIVKLPQK